MDISVSLISLSTQNVCYRSLKSTHQNEPDGEEAGRKGNVEAKFSQALVGKQKFVDNLKFCTPRVYDL
jgi:hypothetical protein